MALACQVKAHERKYDHLRRISEYKCAVTEQEKVYFTSEVIYDPFDISGQPLEIKTKNVENGKESSLKFNQEGRAEVTYLLGDSKLKYLQSENGDFIFGNVSFTQENMDELFPKLFETYRITLRENAKCERTEVNGRINLSCQF
jgi:hypothetical protein